MCDTSIDGGDFARAYARFIVWISHGDAAESEVERTRTALLVRLLCLLPR